MLPRDEAPVNARQWVESDSDDAAIGVLRWSGARPELNLVLELFLRELSGRLFRDVRAVYLYGSAALDDLAPATGDIDLLVLTRRDLGRSGVGEVSVLHRYLAGKAFAPWGAMLEATYCSAAAAADPKKPGAGIYSKGGEVKSIAKVTLGPLQRLFVRDGGILIYGDDLKSTIPAPKAAELLGETKEALKRARSLDAGAPDSDVIAMVPRLARMLCVLHGGRAVSKSEATKWFASRVRGKAGDVASEANKLRRGELKTGAGGIRRLLPDFLDVVTAELADRERDIKQGK
jgi:hypothetical protein